METLFDHNSHTPVPVNMSLDVLTLTPSLPDRPQATPPTSVDPTQNPLLRPELEIESEIKRQWGAYFSRRRSGSSRMKKKIEKVPGGAAVGCGDGESKNKERLGQRSPLQPVSGNIGGVENEDWSDALLARKKRQKRILKKLAGRKTCPSSIKDESLPPSKCATPRYLVLTGEEVKLASQYDSSSRAPPLNELPCSDTPFSEEPTDREAKTSAKLLISVLTMLQRKWDETDGEETAEETPRIYDGEVKHDNRGKTLNPETYGTESYRPMDLLAFNTREPFSLPAEKDKSNCNDASSQSDGMEVESFDGTDCGISQNPGMSSETTTGFRMSSADFDELIDFHNRLIQRVVKCCANQSEIQAEAEDKLGQSKQLLELMEQDYKQAMIEKDTLAFQLMVARELNILEYVPTKAHDFSQYKTSKEAQTSSEKANGNHMDSKNKWLAFLEELEFFLRILGAKMTRFFHKDNTSKIIQNMFHDLFLCLETFKMQRIRKRDISLQEKEVNARTDGKKSVGKMENGILNAQPDESLYRGPENYFSSNTVAMDRVYKKKGRMKHGEDGTQFERNMLRGGMADPAIAGYTCTEDDLRFKLELLSQKLCRTNFNYENNLAKVWRKYAEFQKSQKTLSFCVKKHMIGNGDLRVSLLNSLSQTLRDVAEEKMHWLQERVDAEILLEKWNMEGDKTFIKWLELQEVQEQHQEQERARARFRDLTEEEKRMILRERTKSLDRKSEITEEVEQCRRCKEYKERCARLLSSELEAARATSTPAQRMEEIRARRVELTKAMVEKSRQHSRILQLEKVLVLAGVPLPEFPDNPVADDRMQTPAELLCWQQIELQNAGDEIEDLKADLEEQQTKHKSELSWVKAKQAEGRRRIRELERRLTQARTMLCSSEPMALVGPQVQKQTGKQKNTIHKGSMPFIAREFELYQNSTALTTGPATDGAAIPNLFAYHAHPTSPINVQTSAMIRPPLPSNDMVSYTEEQYRELEMKHAIAEAALEDRRDEIKRLEKTVERMGRKCDIAEMGLQALTDDGLRTREMLNMKINTLEKINRDLQADKDRVYQELAKADEQLQNYMAGRSLGDSLVGLRATERIAVLEATVQHLSSEPNPAVVEEPEVLRRKHKEEFQQKDRIIRYLRMRITELESDLSQRDQKLAEAGDIRETQVKAHIAEVTELKNRVIDMERMLKSKDDEKRKHEVGETVLRKILNESDAELAKVKSQLYSAQSRWKEELDALKCSNQRETANWKDEADVINKKLANAEQKTQDKTAECMKLQNELDKLKEKVADGLASQVNGKLDEQELQEQTTEKLKLALEATEKRARKMGQKFSVEKERAKQLEVERESFITRSEIAEKELAETKKEQLRLTNKLNAAEKNLKKEKSLVEGVRKELANEQTLNNSALERYKNQVSSLLKEITEISEKNQRNQQKYRDEVEAQRIHYATLELKHGALKKKYSKYIISPLKAWDLSQLERATRLEKLVCELGVRNDQLWFCYARANKLIENLMDELAVAKNQVWNSAATMVLSGSQTCSSLWTYDEKPLEDKETVPVEEFKRIVGIAREFRHRYHCARLQVVELSRLLEPNYTFYAFNRVLAEYAVVVRRLLSINKHSFPEDLENKTCLGQVDLRVGDKRDWVHVVTEFLRLNGVYTVGDGNGLGELYPVHQTQILDRQEWVDLEAVDRLSRVVRCRIPYCVKGEHHMAKFTELPDYMVKGTLEQMIILPRNVVEACAALPGENADLLFDYLRFLEDRREEYFENDVGKAQLNVRFDQEAFEEARMRRNGDGWEKVDKYLTYTLDKKLEMPSGLPEDERGGLCASCKELMEVYREEILLGQREKEENETEPPSMPCTNTTCDGGRILKEGSEVFARSFNADVKKYMQEKGTVQVEMDAVKAFWNAVVRGDKLCPCKARSLGSFEEDEEDDERKEHPDGIKRGGCRVASVCGCRCLCHRPPLLAAKENSDGDDDTLDERSDENSVGKCEDGRG